jgi:hypothetical protein
MSGVLAVLGAIVVLALVLRAATAALVLTGVAQDVAKFQVRSALFSAGFTTAESESVVNHPVRRRIVQWLIVGGAIGISGLVTSSIVSLARETSVIAPLATLVAGLVALWALASVRVVDEAIVRACAAVLRRTTSLEITRYESLLRVSGDHAVAQVVAHPGGRLAGAPLSVLPAEVTVLGVQRAGGRFEHAPPASLTVEAGDLLTVYGRDEVVRQLDRSEGAPSILTVRE